MKINLKNNWSEQFIYGDKTPSYFVGRKYEIIALQNIIKNTDSSSILISGIRGSGKTSFVHKAISELDKNYVPIFVNLGHILSQLDDEQKSSKRIFIRALIRSLYLSDNFKKDKRLEKLYNQSLGEFKKIEEEKKEKIDKKEIGIKEEIQLNGKNIIIFISILFFALGISLESVICRTILSIIGLGLFALTVNWKKEWINILSNRESTIIDDSTEYLEIEFEKFLKEIKKQNKKIIFIIDELDKVKEGKVFDFIKEFKNLFTRAFAHFIFISSEQAFSLSQKDRTLNIKEGGHYPTFFNHVFYLSLPSRGEIKEYIKEIFVVNDLDQEEVKHLINYLLFKSGNDFFALKRLISDILLFDENNKPYINIDEIKKNDNYFEEKAKLFEYIMKSFVDYNWSKLKLNWKQNSEMQKIVFDFLNKYYPNSFFDVNLENDVEKSLAGEFVRIGHYSKRQVTQADIQNNKVNLTLNNFVYECTFKFNNDINAGLREEEKQFQKNFREMVRVANILDDLPEAFNDENRFSNENKIYENRDGSQYSGINLYNIFNKYKQLFNDLKDSIKRLGIKKEEVEETNKIILEQINSIKNKYWNILLNLLNNILPANIVKNQMINNNLSLFSGLPFISQLNGHENRLYRKNDNSRIVILLNEFENISSLNNLEVLLDRQDILLININKGDYFKNEKVVIDIDYKDKIGRNRSKRKELNNFINIKLTDVKDLAEVMKLVNNHLSNQN